MKDNAQTFSSSFRSRELVCEMEYRRIGDCWHIFTPESFPVIFGTEKDFKSGMCLIAICAKAFPEVKVLTFEIMSNHLHLAVAGEKDSVMRFFRMICRYLAMYLKGQSSPVDLSGWEDCLPRKIGDLNDLRNVIVYDNRNGYLVDPDSTPFSYPWGANRLFFCPELRWFHESSGERLTLRSIREMFHTRLLDGYCGMKMVNGCVSPVEFCDFTSAERLFRDAHHYFNMVSRDIESKKVIANEIGERIFYADNELFTLISAKCRSEYNVSNASLLPYEAKIELARMLHFEYNADNPKVARIMRMDISLVDTLFPSGRK